MVTLLLAIIYISFISLGLPDALLGSAWPVMHQDLNVAVSMAGGISLTVAAGTVVSSLMSDRLTLWLGTGKVTAISVGMTALALFGFSISTEYWHLLLWAVPYGLGAGSVDASLNNYVALHYSSRVMSWLHCMWGVGASAGPYILGMALTGGMTWNTGYRIIGIFQVCLTAVLFLSLPLWKPRKEVTEPSGKKAKPLTLMQIFAIPGAKEILIAFFCYCAMEQTAILWASSYFVMNNGVSEELAASFGSLFLIGITVGRGLSGFLTVKFNDTNMIRLGQGIVMLGILVMFLPPGESGGHRGPAAHRSGLRPHLSLRDPLHPRPLRGGKIPGHHRCPDGCGLHRHLPDAAPVRPDRKLYHRGPAARVSGCNHHPDDRYVRAVKPEMRPLINRQRTGNCILQFPVLLIPGLA